MATHKTAWPSPEAVAAFQRFLKELVAQQILTPGFWGDLTLHIRDGSLSHVRLEQTLKFPEHKETTEP